MNDSFHRNINYIRISVTDRCNLRCRYCMPEEGIESTSMADILTYEEIARICTEAAGLGITKVRLTGGEPLIRRGITSLVAMINRIPGIESISLTTNGILLPDMLDDLIDAGLTGVNISLDTMDRQAFSYITGRDELPRVLDGIHSALEQDIKVKVNAVLLPEGFYHTDSNAPANWRSLLPLAQNNPLDLRFIELMPIGLGKEYYHIPSKDILSRLQDMYPGITADHSVHGNGPAVYYHIPEFQGSIGFIEALHGKFCSSCNRIRITATGQVKPCLCYADSFDIRTPLRNGSDKQVRDILQQAIMAKPAAHCFDLPSEISEEKKMVSIGG